MVYSDCNHYNLIKGAADMDKEKIISLFKSKGFRATPQRIAVFDYVYSNRTHPDVLEIYDFVLKNNPSFSKTTVYNALKSLTEYGFLKTVCIDGERIRYDANTALHGHFRCEGCGKIFDFEVSGLKFKVPEGFIVKQKDVYYSGLCNCCKK